MMVYRTYIWGYWVKGSRKMQYKSRFQPYELLSKDGWHEGGNT